MSQKLPSEVANALSAPLRRGIVEFLTARRITVLEAMAVSTDIDVIRRFQGRADELADQIKIFTQEK